MLSELTGTKVECSFACVVNLSAIPGIVEGGTTVSMESILGIGAARRGCPR